MAKVTSFDLSSDLFPTLKKGGARGFKPRLNPPILLVAWALQYPLAS